MALTQPGDGGGETPLHLTPLFWLNCLMGKILLRDSGCPVEVSVKRSMLMRYFQDFGETADTYSIMCLSGTDRGFLFGVSSSVSFKSLTEPCLLEVGR